MYMYRVRLVAELQCIDSTGELINPAKSMVLGFRSSDDRSVT